jgi:hypothetical protein
MKYLGSLSDLKDTMFNAKQSLEHLDSVMGKVTTIANQARRGRNMGGLGDASITSPIDFGAAGDTGSDIDFGQESTVTSQVTNPATGNVTTKYANGTVVITNPQGQNITSSFIPTSGVTQPASTGALIASSVGDAVSNVPSTLTNAAGSALNSVSGVLTPIAIIAGCGLIAFLLFNEGKR